MHGIRTFAFEENCPPVGVRVWVRIRVSFKVGEWEVIFVDVTVLEPIITDQALRSQTIGHKTLQITTSFYNHFVGIVFRLLKPNFIRYICFSLSVLLCTLFKEICLKISLKNNFARNYTPEIREF